MSARIGRSLADARARNDHERIGVPLSSLPMLILHYGCRKTVVLVTW
jgi:hypothetical protein